MKARLGDTITRQDGRRYRLCAADENGRFIVEPLDAFGPVEAYAEAELLTGFDVTAVAKAESEQDIMRRLDREATDAAREAYFTGREKPPVLPRAGSPERAFVERAAEDIFADADKLAAYEIGRLEVSPPVAALLDRLIAGRNDAEPVRPRRRRRR